MFAAEESFTKDSGASLAYTSHKKTKPAPAPAPVSAAAATAPGAAPAAAVGPTVIHAALCNLIKYEASGATSVVGQRACTVLKTGGSFVLVCYDPQTQKQDAVATLNENFTLTVSTPPYAMFYDDSRTYFAIQLANTDQIDALARHVALAKNAFITQNNPTSAQLIIQELSVSEG